MVAPRNLSQPLGRGPFPPPFAVEFLARRLGRLRCAEDPRVVARLATLLRKLSTVIKAEPYWPLAARELGPEFLATGLFDTSADAPDGVDATMAAALQVLRRDAPGMLALTGEESERRFVAALDELIGGMLGELAGLARRRGPRPRAQDTGPLPGGNDLDAMFEQAEVGIAILGLDGTVQHQNAALRAILGLDGQLPEPRSSADWVHPDDNGEAVIHLTRIAAGETDLERFELRVIRDDQQVRWVDVTGFRVAGPDGAPSHLMAYVRDVTVQHAQHGHPPEVSHQDQLTRLPNQAVAQEWLQMAFAPGGSAGVGLCALDLDGFHLITEELGQQIGDRLLLGVAGRLQMAAGTHLVARAGGDRFLVLMTDPDGLSDVSALADRLLASMATPFHVDGNPITLSASVGVAETCTAAGSPAELARAADAARSWAKALGGGRRVEFDPQRDGAEAARFALVTGMRGAITRDEFRLVYQPLVRLADGVLRGAEALVRWQHPDLGLLGPNRFIELAEHSGAIVQLGRWVLEEACRQAAEWCTRLGADTLYVSVNVSPVQLAEPGWVADVTGVLEETGLPAHQLQLEITEQAVLGDEAVAFESLSALRAVGVRLALDDFGTGYSSLAWLRRLPVHALKIDGAFIDGLRNPLPDSTDTSIVRALVEMAHGLGLEVTAEWVETVVQAERLVALGCDMGQGRWFGDPGPGEWVPDLFRRSIIT